MKAAAVKKSSTATSPAAMQAANPFFAPVQMKMAVNQPGDRFEQEADRVSARVMRLAAVEPAENAQRQAPGEAGKETVRRQAPGQPPKERIHGKEETVRRVTIEEERQREDEKVLKPRTNLGEFQRKERAAPGPEIGTDLQTAIGEKMTGGEPLSPDTRHFMEPRIGADFGDVRVHTDPQSAALASGLNARAFTYQNHLFFSADQYQPTTNEGKRLLAHELTHTVQQGHGVQRKTESPVVDKATDGVQKAPAPPKAEPAPTSSEVVDLSTGAFEPSQKVRDEIEARGAKGLQVRIAVKGLASEGTIKVRADRKKNYDSIGKGSMPLTAPWAQTFGGMYLNLRLVNSEIKGGYASLKPGGGDTNDWLQAVRKNSALLGGLGLKVENLPTPVNKFEGGKLTVGVTNLKVEVGGYVAALFCITIENADQPKIEASSDINIKGIAKAQLKLDNTSGKLAGQVTVAVEYKSFSGMGTVKYNPDGSVDFGGKAAYNADRLSGEVEFVATDLDTANAFAKDAIAAAGGKEKVQDAPPPAPVPAPKPGKKQRGLAAVGILTFNLTTWFAGTVHVVVDGKGAVTVIGRIAPPAEIILFKQRDWDKELIKLEAKAYYGIPVVGNLNLFANVSLHAIASLGPAKIYNIEVLGCYSTDPEIQKFIQISGSFNISAYAGLRLRAEGGAGVEIASHDLKFGIGLQADVGVKAYVDARPTVGYRDPGEFYVSGTLEMVAQPMLGLGGDFFIALETPWWSPISDHRWTWPLFSKEWPLTDPIGINAVVKEYVLGSGKVPEIELKKPEFDPSKFMSKMVDNDLPDKSGKGGGGQGTFKDDGTVKKPEVPPKKPAPKKPDAKGAPKKGTPPKAGKSAKPDPKTAKDLPATKILQNASKPLAALKGKGPLGRTELNKELAKIKAQVGGIDFDVQQKGDKWVVTPKAGGRPGRAIEVKAKAVDGAAKPEARTEEQMVKDVHAAAAEVEIEVGVAPDRETVKQKLPRIKARFKLTALFIEDLPNGAFHVIAEINPRWPTKTYPPGESKYVMIDPADQKRKLREQYRGSFMIRTRFYLLGQGYGGTLTPIMERKIAERSYRKEDGNFVRDPAGEFWVGDPSRPGRIVPKKSDTTYPTVEHSKSVRDHWNTEGNRIDQKSRRAWVTFKGEEESAPIVDFETNRSAPSATQEGYTEIVETSFKGPGEK